MAPQIIAIQILKTQIKNQLKIAYCQKVLPEIYVIEIKKNDRVIGGINTKSAIAAKNSIQHFCSGKFNLTNARNS